MNNGVQIAQGCNLVILQCDTTTAWGRALATIAETHAVKDHDYAGEDDEWVGFRQTSEHMGIPLWESADFNEVQKLGRLKTLRERGEDPLSETVEDTYRDKAVYAVLAYAMYLEYLRINEGELLFNEDSLGEESTNADQ